MIVLSITVLAVQVPSLVMTRSLQRSLAVMTVYVAYAMVQQGTVVISALVAVWLRMEVLPATQVKHTFTYADLLDYAHTTSLELSSLMYFHVSPNSFSVRIAIGTGIVSLGMQSSNF